MEDRYEPIHLHDGSAERVLLLYQKIGPVTGYFWQGEWRNHLNPAMREQPVAYQQLPPLPNHMTMHQAPKDGSLISVLEPAHWVQVFWCDDLKGWITAREIRVNRVHNPLRWRARGAG